MTANITEHISCLNCKHANASLHATAKDVEYFTTDKDYKYYRCNNCHVLFIDPVPVNELNVIYPPNYYSFTWRSKSIPFRIKNYFDAIFFRKILKDIKAGSINILDVGGGTGASLDLMKKIDKRVQSTTVIDIDSGARQEAERNGHQYFCGRIEEYDDVQKYHLILMLNLIEHVANPAEVLQKANELLLPGGVIIIKTPNHDSLDARLFRNHNWVGYHCPRHWVIFDKKSFSNLAMQPGFKINKWSYTQGAPFWAQSILHLMHKRNLINASAQNPLIYHPLFAPLSLLAATFDMLRKFFSPLSQMWFVLKKV